jgi:signal transduction histidine kinase
MRDKYDQQVGWLATLHEITERKKLQEKIIAQDRLASIGQLASGIAHEINNPLTPVIGYSELLLKQNVAEDIKTDLQAINDNAKRVSNIVGKLLTFARGNHPVRSLCRIDEILESTIQLRAFQLEESGIRLIRDFAPQLPQTMADSSQLEQVFLNLIINAEYEMNRANGGGVLSVKTEKRENAIRISIKDDGPGIYKENMAKLFTPFFTTKPVGEGTGLGLSICHGIVAEHNGKIYAESEIGKGTTFVVELPVTNVDI